MTKKPARSLPESGLSKTEEDSGARISEASSSTKRAGTDGSNAKDSSASHSDGGAKVEVPDGEPSTGNGLSREHSGSSDGARDSEAASDNASLTSDDATPVASGSVAGLDWAQPDHEDHFDDADSALGDDSASSTQSLSSSILQYRIIHGRRYHSLRGDGDTEYWQPNDEQQNLYAEYSTVSSELQAQCSYGPADITQTCCYLTAGYTSPRYPKTSRTSLMLVRGLDNDFGDAHPHAQVRGVDLSPIQPAWIPPNVLFEIDDIAQEWTYQPNHFDFIYLRSLHGCIKDWDLFFREAYKCCKPGGWVETFHMDLRPQSDDGSVRPGMAILSMYDHLVAAGRRMGRPMDLLVHHTMVRSMEAAGFVDVRETNLKKPMTDSFGDRKMREIGGFQHAALTEGLEGLVLYPLGQVLGWPLIQIQLMLARVRTELSSQKVHPWLRVQIVYARKPL
ncbi:hypothetical protein PG997_004876 [Apiospora hydei]|uniref:Methyltransferase n=1 Tax=Apiospora hydei TaxID=1337664 RepID=A0ABR1X3B3_9PEZI